MRVAITGAATGIGAEAARKLKEQGHHVTAFDVKEPAANIDVWIKTDLSDQTSIVASLNKAAGPFDALINNAGIPPRDGLAEAILQVNFLGFRVFLEKMLPKLSEGAAIVNTASRAGARWRDNIEQVKSLLRTVPPDAAKFVVTHKIDPTRAYNLTKEAVIVYTMQQTQNMMSRNLRMNSVSPAAVTTGILEDFAVAFGDKMTKNLARSGRPGKPDEIADVILFLISPQSAWIKGQDICVDGGMTGIGISEALAL